MNVRRIDLTSNDSFLFTKVNKDSANKEIAKYPEGRQASAIIAILWIAQKQNNGWLSESAISHVSDFLDMQKIRVLEIATFYSMFNLSPVGKYHIQLCGTTPCMLCGAESLKKVLNKEIGVVGSLTKDKLLSWVEVECLGTCCNAPMVQINDYYYEDLDEVSFKKIIKDLKSGKEIKTGSYKGRLTSEPSKDPIVLLDDEIEKINIKRIKPGLK
jgi:NADH-quinone oxidoreductase subunit E